MGRFAFLTFSIFAACVIAGCFALGAWQLQRHYWKADLLIQAQAVANAAPIAFPEGADDFPAYRQFEVTGQFLEGYDIPIRGHALEGVSGARMFAPFKLSDGRIMLIQRGWVARGREAYQGVQDRGLETLTILWRPFVGDPSRNRLFSPVNSAEYNIWSYPDPIAMADFWGLSVIPNGHGEIRGQQGAAQGARVEPFRADLFNSHLEYVATWWSMVGIMALIYAQAWRRRRRAT